MVQLDKVPGQKGHMVIHEDGSILSSSGELASSESTSQQMLNMLSHSMPVNFETMTSNGQGGVTSGGSNHDQGNTSFSNGAGDNNQEGQVWKWNRVTVDFGDHSYLACLSNKRIHVVKRDNSQVEMEQPNNGQ